MSAPRKILVAVAWPYANGPRHIGHVAGFGVPSDIFARYHRLRGNDVLMVSGTDEHGTPIMVAADREGLSPRELVDRNSAVIREDLRRLGLSYDLFTRTTTANHHRVVRDVFRTLWENGYITEQTAVGAFSASTGQTLPDRYVEGTCPICGFGDARGDQCDNCGNQLDPVDLVEPRSKIDGQPPVFRETTHLFIDLPAFRERLTAWIDEQRHWRPNVRRFSLELLKEVRPRPVTRDLDWGVRIPVPGYDELDDKRIYVWFDAVIGYLSASVEWAANRGTPDAWREWWQSPDARHYYFMGKDNIVFHSVIWPSQLLGYGEGGELGSGRGPLELPYDIVSSEFLTMEGQPVLDQPQRRHLRRRLPRPLRRRSAAVLPHRGRARDAGQRLHVGGVRAAQQRRARRELGEPRQPHAHQQPQELRCRSHPGAADGRRQRPCSLPSKGASRR